MMMTSLPSSSALPIPIIVILRSKFPITPQSSSVSEECGERTRLTVKIGINGGEWKVAEVEEEEVRGKGKRKNKKMVCVQRSINKESANEAKATKKQQQ